MNTEDSAKTQSTFHSHNHKELLRVLTIIDTEFALLHLKDNILKKSFDEFGISLSQTEKIFRPSSYMCVHRLPTMYTSTPFTRNACLLYGISIDSRNAYCVGFITTKAGVWLFWLLFDVIISLVEFFYGRTLFSNCLIRNISVKRRFFMNNELRYFIKITTVTAFFVVLVNYKKQLAKLIGSPRHIILNWFVRHLDPLLVCYI